MSRYAKHRRVYFVEEPIIGEVKIPEMNVIKSTESVNIVVPHLPENLKHDQNTIIENLLKNFVSQHSIRNYSTWYYTPMALNFSRHLKPSCCIYDCMDELSNFKGAPRELMIREEELLKKADLVFTGGQSLFEAKQHLHKNIHPFRSGIDIQHFNQARLPQAEPPDQKNIPHPRLGFYGVIDERMDIKLLKELAELCPTWHFIIIGPVVKINSEQLPKNRNIHYLGKKDYAELPSYLASWDCAIMPFALNESTRYISPTKTPEFLAAGRPVVSTPIRDVVEPYGVQDLVAIANNAREFADKAADSMHRSRLDRLWINRVDEFLKEMAWDEIWKKMSVLETRHVKKIDVAKARSFIDKERNSSKWV